MNLEELSHQDLYNELEKVIRLWQKLDQEWQRRWLARKGKPEAEREITHSGYDSEAPLITPFAQLMPDEPSISPDPTPDTLTNFDGGGGESGGAGSTGDW